MNSARRERVLGCVGAAFAVAYIAHARTIENSLLSDSVGAGGVPQAAGTALLVASLALLGKSLAVGNASREGRAAGTAALARPLQLGAALAAALVAYVLLLPWLGYVLTLSALVLTVALLAGARTSWALALFAALSGVTMWALFQGLLKIRMPTGSIWS